MINRLRNQFEFNKTFFVNFIIIIIAINYYIIIIIAITLSLATYKYITQIFNLNI